jgi:hypothetical protein
MPPRSGVGAARAGAMVRPGHPIVRVAVAGTALFAVTATLAAAVPSADVVALAVAVGLFVAGCGAFVAAYAAAVGRSRRDDIALAGLFFLSGSAPRPVRVALLGSLAAQVVVAFTTAGIRPNTSLAFGVLAPVYGLGLAALWAARHGRFPPRAAPPSRRPPKAPPGGPVPSPDP